MTNRLSTDDVAAKERFDYWQYVVGELIGNFDLGDYDPTNFEGHFDLSVVGDLKIGSFKGSSQTLHRKTSSISSGETDDYILLLESDKTFVLDHCGHQRADKGGMVFIDVTRPFYSSHPESLEVIDVFIPRKALESALGPVRRAAGLALDPTQASFPVIASFLRTLMTHGSKLDPTSASRMSSIAIELIAAGLAERIAQTPTMSGAALLCRAQAFIADHLGTAGLGMQEVAAALNISVRRLHQVAADEGISLVDWMWTRRLERARAMLADPAHLSVQVATIGFQCGFSDQAHFSRRFKEHFGVSPTECRMAAIGGRLNAQTVLVP